MKVYLTPRKTLFFRYFSHIVLRFDKDGKKYDSNNINFSRFEITGFRLMYLNSLILCPYAFPVFDGFNGHS